MDTNILIHADDQDAGPKQARARELMVSLVASGAAVVSTQVLQEFFVVATTRLGLTSEQARARVENLARLDVVLLRPDLILAAIDLHRLRSISLWDALMVRAAAAGGCGRLLSDDLQNGLVIDGVRIENPFV